MNYKVLIQHFGDKQYYAGDTRVIESEFDAQALIEAGLIIAESEYVAPPPPKPRAKKNKCKVEPTQPPTAEYEVPQDS